jgi:hypothetical protein
MEPIWDEAVAHGKGIGCRLSVHLLRRSNTSARNSHQNGPGSPDFRHSGNGGADAAACRKNSAW